MILAGTGHRELDHPESQIRAAIKDTLLEAKPTAVYVGMASGFDLLLGDMCYLMRIPYVAVRPWRGHVPRQKDENLYLGVWNFALNRIDATDHDDYPGPWCYEVRNRIMVDESTHVLAYFSGKPGGTKNCIDYATSQKKKHRNLYGR